MPSWPSVLLDDTTQMGQFQDEVLELGLVLVMHGILEFLLRSFDAAGQFVLVELFNRNGGLGKQCAARRQDIGETAEHDIVLLLAGAGADAHDTRLDRRHRRRMMRHNRHLAFGCGNDDLGHHLRQQQTLRRNELKVEIVSHQ
ncbi:hypothetical protein RHECNPAF_750088 [Rhizobium etli CNPAF512]|nr:hypothetical protein RHECNPAF_750088 [Rhizobium etli CNPAF512]